MISHIAGMREFKVILKGAKGEAAPFYVVMVRHACRARSIALELVERDGYAAAEIYEGGILLDTVPAGTAGPSGMVGPSASRGSQPRP